MKEIITSFAKILPLKARISLFFKYKHSYPMNFSNPVTFSQKIQARKLKLNQDDANLADKYRVREFVEERIGSEFLIPLLGVYDCISLDILNNIPMNSVIKTNHGSGVNHIHFLTESSDRKAVVRQFEKSLRENYSGSILGESHYDLIERKIIIEEKLDFDGDSPPDFKFHVFKNKNNLDWVLQVDFDRFTDHKRNLYDSNLNKLDLEIIYKNGSFELPCENIIRRMADIAINLSCDYNYARVDLYLHNENIYFGEITLTPESGFGKFSSKDFDIYFGNLWGDS